MKKRQVVGLVVAGLLAGFVSHAVAQSATAYSSSAIGVIKKTIPANKMVCLSVPLDQPSDTGNGYVFSEVPAFSNMPNLSVVNFWDAEAQKWVPQTKTAKGGWGAQKNRLVKPGEAIFLQNNQDSDISLVLSGEVPSDDAIQTAFAQDAMMFVANPYPVAMTFSDFSFAATLPNLSVANFWDEEAQVWVPQTKTSKGGWGAQKDRVIQPGEGFIITSHGADVTWSESRPYTWPN